MKTYYTEMDFISHGNDILSDGKIIFNADNKNLFKIGNGIQKLKDLPYCCSMVNKDTPVDKFNNNAELNKYLKEWQERLYLNDWNIVCLLVDKSEIENGFAESVKYNYIENFAIIKLARRPIEEIVGEINRRPDELVLVHQLLHLVMNINYNEETDNYEYYDYKHNVLDKLARSLIMTKYNLSNDWFKNN